ncbi:hypothetical protein G6F57_014735 [Rhizopus arrhizus]|nr:hypothetical protein G6F57_014735 [Rhizopus arrhizus]
MEVLQPHQFQVAAGPGAARCLVHALQLQAEFRVLQYVQPGQQGVLLEDDAAVGARPHDGAAPQRDFPLGGGQEPGQQAEQGGLAAARGAQRDDEFARLDDRDR